MSTGDETSALRNVALPLGSATERPAIVTERLTIRLERVAIVTERISIASLSRAVPASWLADATEPLTTASGSPRVPT